MSIKGYWLEILVNPLFIIIIRSEMRRLAQVNVDCFLSL